MSETNMKPIYKTTIGLEIHTQLATKTKAWCDCEIVVNSLENNFVCEVCSAQPGTLPVMNNQSIDYALSLGIALNCEINKVSYFDRKNYFYPDLPKGFQITQFEKPIGENGFVEIIKKDGSSKKIRIERIQLEEDTGKSTHFDNHSLINLNRSGTPLIEIVTRPDFEDEEESVLFLKKLQSTLVYLGVSKGNMQDGNLRCDVNLSVSCTDKLGVRTEVKNLNSFRSVERAIKHERTRQTEVLSSGGSVDQQTLLFNVETGKTKVLRTKSDADDYRYHREPDLLPLVISQERIEKIRKVLPELPDVKMKRFVSEFSIPVYDAEVICSDKALAEYFEKACKLGENHNVNFKSISNWTMGEVLRLLNEYKLTPEKSKVDPKNLVLLISEIDKGVISGTVAKEVFVEMFDTGKTAREIISAKGLEQNSDETELQKIVAELIEAHPDEVQQLLSGRDRVMGFFVGQVMKKTQGKANPKMTTQIVLKLIKK